MRIAAWVENYPPDFCAGAEMSLHETLVALQSKGHEVCVYRRSSRSYDFEGVPVRQASARQGYEISARHDVIFVQTSGTRQGCHLFKDRLPIVHFAHAYEQFMLESVSTDDAQLVVMNSRSMVEKMAWPGRQIIIPPTINKKRYETTRGQRITLINLNENKGGELFWQIAAAMPDHQFLAVKGAYKKQIIPKRIPQNVVLMEHTSDAKDIYEQTRILLMPSLSETWGRTAIEAGVSGIPTIAHRSPGLEEALGKAGIFADRAHCKEWVQAIHTLDDQTAYQVASKLSLSNSLSVTDSKYIDELETSLFSVIENSKKTTNGV